MSRLRTVAFHITPVLVADDGLELAPGPGVQTAVVPASDLLAFAAGWPEQLARLQAAYDEQQTPAPTTTLHAVPEPNPTGQEATP